MKIVERSRGECSGASLPIPQVDSCLGTLATPLAVATPLRGLHDLSSYTTWQRRHGARSVSQSAIS